MRYILIFECDEKDLATMISATAGTASLRDARPKRAEDDASGGPKMRTVRKHAPRVRASGALRGVDIVTQALERAGKAGLKLDQLKALFAANNSSPNSASPAISQLRREGSVGVDQKTGVYVLSKFVK